MAINLTRSWNSPRLGRDLCGLLTALDEPDPVAFMQARFLPLVAGAGSYFRREATINAPRVVEFWVDNVPIVLLQGVKRADTAANLFRAYGSAGRLSDNNIYNRGVNEQIIAARDEILAWQGARPSGWQWNVNTIIAGHSFGGAVAQALATDVGKFPGNQGGCVTFGAPRVAQATGVRLLNTVPNIRWYNVDDPIRHMPPNPTEAPLAHGLLPRGLSDEYRFYHHAGDGYALQRTGQYTRVQDVPPDPAIADRSLITWASGINDANVLAHSIREYFSRMQAAMDLFDHTYPMAPNFLPPRDTTPPSPPASEVPAVRAALDAANVTTRQQVQALNAVRQPAYFRAIRRNAHYMVVDRDRNTVVLAASRVRARNISARANELYREALANGVDDLSGVYVQVSQMI